MRPMHVGILTAVTTFAVDQGFKHLMLDVYHIENRPILHVTPFFDILIAWNKGVSYSLFTANSAIERYGLLAVYALACLAFAVWMVQAPRTLTKVALGLLIGGASGNALDRVLYGAVADFFHVYFGTISPWGVFNLADIAIVAGVGLLLYESFFVKEE